jgi:PIN domain nuclease of toxin-antitoxin system
MKYLLDTHALIWFLEGDARLSETAKAIICNDSVDIHVSIVSLWEMAIKLSLGKLKLSQTLEQIMAELLQQNIALLPIQTAHLIPLLSLPFEHRDPFDRLLISQALVEDMGLLSNEALFISYGVDRVW